MAHQDRNQHNLVQLARNYATDVRPSRSDRQQFSALMMAQFETLTDEAKQEIANALCLCHHLDLHVASLIAKAPANVCGRFLRFSPLFEEEMLLALVLGDDFQRNLSIARRQDLPKSVSRILRDTRDADINRALDLRQKPRSAKTKHALSVADQLLHAAQSRDLSTMCTVLKRQLSITQESAFVLLSDKSSANLIIAFKFCGLSVDQAWECYTYLAPGLAETTGQQNDFSMAYKAHDAATCAQTVKAWVMDDLLARVSAPSIANDQLGAAEVSPSDKTTVYFKSA